MNITETKLNAVEKLDGMQHHRRIIQFLISARTSVVSYSY